MFISVVANAKRSYWGMADVDEQVDRNEYAMTQLAHSPCSAIVSHVSAMRNTDTSQHV